MVTFAFAPTKELIAQYKVFGNFYNVKEQGKLAKYRNGLHIIDRNYYVKNGLSKSVKLLVIMMNPGESTPLSNEKCISHFTWEEVIRKEHCKEPILTKPDRTQYQVMRMMRGLNVKHSRVINITDIRETRSNHLVEELQAAPSDFHSIFSNDRNEELQDVYSTLDNNGIIFLAWGSSIITCKPFKKLAEKCISSLPNDKVVLGIRGNGHLKYKHPLPRGRSGNPRSWLKKAEECFNDYFENVDK